VADFIFNIAKGKIAQYTSQVGTANAALVLLFVKSAGLEADATLKDYDTIQALLAGTTDEADFTNYVRKTITAATVTVDDTNDRVDLSFTSPVTWTSAGGASNNTLGALIIAFDNDTTSGTDANLVPVAKYDVSLTTNGTNVTVTLNAAGFARAA